MSGRRRFAIVERIVLLALCLPAWCAAASSPAPDAAAYAADFRQFCDFVRDEYAYFDTRATDWQATCNALESPARMARSRDEFIATLESALSQLYDTHSHLGTNTRASYRLVPTGSQLRLAWRDGRARVMDVRQRSAASAAGIHVGDELLAIDEVPVANVTAALEPKHVSRVDAAARDWALNVAVAGTHQRDSRKLLLRSGATERTVEFRAEDAGTEPGLLESRRIGNTGYIRIHNALGNDALVAEFDRAIQDLAGVSGLILDLRDTPSGGNSLVARGIMGHLVSVSSPYQRHEYVAEGRATGVPRVWMEYVAPRPARFDAPVVVLVGAWTGSMGEGIAIGLNGARGIPVLGHRMAQLLGALGEIRLSHTGIIVRIPTEKLFHVDGTPREAFMPREIDESAEADVPLETALRMLAR